MPRAEYVPYSTVKPEGPKQVTERLDISFPQVEFHNSIGKALGQIGEQGFGTLSRATKEVASAFDNLGANFEHTGNQLWQRAIGLQEVQNQTTQTKAEIEYDKYANDEQVKFGQLQGDAANEGAYKAHLTNLEDKRKELLEKLPNQAVRNGFDNSTSRTVGRLGMQAAEHAAKETRKSFIESSEARVDQYRDQISKTTDIEETKRLAEKVHDEIFGKQAPAKGWTPEIAAKNLRDVLAEAHASQISTISRTDPTAARNMLLTPENKALIPNPLYDATMNKVLQNEVVIQSTNIGNEIQGKMPDAPIEEKKAEGKKRALEINPNAPLLVEAAERAVEREHNEHRRELAQEEQRHELTVEQELYGFGNKEGKVPTKVQDLYANEDTRRSWEWLQANAPKKANRVLQVLAKSAKGDYPDTPLARTRQWELQGMALNEPGRFRDLDLMMEEIPWSMRSTLRNEQLKIIKEGIKLENDPQTSRALSIMRSVLPKDLTPLHKDKWNTFTGLVREALIAKGKERGFDKPLNEEEIRNLGKTLLEKMPGTGYWPGDWGQQTLYQTLKDVPPEHVDAMRQKFPKETDDQLVQRYRQTIIRDEYNKRYGTSGTKLPQQAPTVTVKTPPEKPPEPPPEQQQPAKPAEKRSEMLGRKAAEFRHLLMTEGVRKREEGKK